MSTFQDHPLPARHQRRPISREHARRRILLYLRLAVLLRRRRGA